MQYLQNAIKQGISVLIQYEILLSLLSFLDRQSGQSQILDSWSAGCSVSMLVRGVGIGIRASICSVLAHGLSSSRAQGPGLQVRLQVRNKLVPNEGRYCVSFWFGFVMISLLLFPGEALSYLSLTSPSPNLSGNELC